MKRIFYAYDVLHYECRVDNVFSYALRVKRYRLNTKLPLFTVSVTRQPLISDFSTLPDDYESKCVTVEERVSPSLPLSEMVSICRKLLCDSFLQLSVDMD